MNRKKIVVLIIVCASLSLISSCASFRKYESNPERQILTEDNLEKIDGTYIQNESIKVYPLDYFWGSLYKTAEYQSVYSLVYENNVPYHVRLKALNKKKIQISISVKDTILKTFIIKGKIKNGYFEQRRKTYLIPLIFFNAYHSSKFRIYLLKNGNIATDYNEKDYATFVLSSKNNSKNLFNIEHCKLMLSN